VNPCVLRKIWRFLTSAPREPIVRLRVQPSPEATAGTAGATAGKEGVGVVTTGVCTVPPTLAFKATLVLGPKLPYPLV